MHVVRFFYSIPFLVCVASSFPVSYTSYVNYKHSLELPSDSASRIVLLVAHLEYAVRQGSFELMQCAYNVLREEKRQPLELAGSSINKSWAHEEGYQAAKIFFRQRLFDFTDQKPSQKMALLSAVSSWLSRVKKDDGGFDAVYWRLLCKYACRFYYEIDGKRNNGELGVNHNWVEKTLRLVIEHYLREKYDLLPPPVENLARSVQRECGVRAPVSFYSSHAPLTGVIHGYPYMTVIPTDDRSSIRLFALYHEMGHLVHGDLGEIRGGGQLAPERTRNNQFKSDCAVIQRHFKKGLHAFSTASVLGRLALDRFKTFKKLWIEPNALETYNTYVFRRACESRADYFAFDRLLKKGKMSVLIDVLYAFGASQYIVAQADADDHPSNFERAVCLAGFLTERGINLNTELVKFEKDRAINSFADLRYKVIHI